jgi:hypothetical protein
MIDVEGGCSPWDSPNFACSKFQLFHVYEVFEYTLMEFAELFSLFFNWPHSFLELSCVHLINIMYQLLGLRMRVIIVIREKKSGRYDS